jgi:ribonuclease HI
MREWTTPEEIEIVENIAANMVFTGWSNWPKANDLVKHDLDIYTDGSHRPKNDKGAYGFVAVYNGNTVLATNCLNDTTNNQMEILGVLSAYHFILQSDAQQLFKTIKVYSDSEYTIKAMTEWWNKWERNGFRKADGKPIANEALFTMLKLIMMQLPDIPLVWCKGHADNDYNNFIDREVQRLTKKP